MLRNKLVQFALFTLLLGLVVGAKFGIYFDELWARCAMALLLVVIGWRVVMC